MNRMYAQWTAASKPGAGFWGSLVVERLHRLFVIVILLQLIQCFGDFWWEETYRVLYGVLAVTAVCELAFSRLYGVRLGLEILTALVLSITYSPAFQWVGWPYNWHSIEQWHYFYENHVAGLHPFIELALGAILFVHAVSWLGQKRSAAVTILISSIGVMATIDSFFPLELWKNIAWMVTAGLGWLVVLHLRQLRSRHPESWAALTERPVELAVPAVIVISLLLLSGIFMPRAPALLEDPYTIWSQAHGIEVPSLPGEGGVLKDSPSFLGGLGGSASSGYGRDDRTIGGGFDFDYSPVMTVSSSRRSYWRGETKAVYSGKGWSDAKSDLLVLGSGTNVQLSTEPGRPGNVKTEKVTQTVTFLRKDRIPVLFGAGPITRLVEVKSDSKGSLAWNPEEWELRWRNPTRVQSYTIESEVTLLDREALRKVKNPEQSAGSIDIRRYLQLPPSLPQRVSDLAAKVTASGTNTFDKAQLLESYLKNTYPYTNEPDMSRQKSADVADAFLFEIKEGYCDYYSTAFVVMARSVGIPARWVKGYASGFDPSLVERGRFAGGLIDPDGAGTYTVRNADAHSWAEVYFEGFGWIPFEPTSGFTVPQPVPDDAAAVTLPQPEASAAPETTGTMNGRIGWWVSALGSAGLVLAAILILRRRRVKASVVWRRIRHAGATPNQRIVRDMEKLLRFMKRRGLRREDHETIRETFKNWGSKFSSLMPEFEGVLQRFEKARYGQDSGAESEARDFAEASAKIRKAF
jgi:transglutaminase-like putative cysteine protease